MKNIDFNTILDRNKIKKEIIDILINFENKKKDISHKRGLYIYGSPGSGKTEFITGLLHELNYDIIKYDTSDVRNKGAIETLTSENISDKSVLSLLKKKMKSVAIIMDEIDGMNNGDKGGINSLIKLVRSKKTKKQKTEEITYTPIICISNYYADKKIKELIKVCDTFEIKKPSDEQIENIITMIMPNVDNKLLLENMVRYIDGDLRKLKSLITIYENNFNIFKNNIIQNIFKQKLYNNDTKEITKDLISNKYSIEEHVTSMNETDRTIVGLLLHENIVDCLDYFKMNTSIPLYLKLLDNICFSDYIDRITFQNQIWQFNEMSSLIKTFHCNKLYHDEIENTNIINNKELELNKELEFHKEKYIPTEIRFTKVLTKYSTEYNNSLFIQNLCQQLGLDKKDTFSFFLELRNIHSDDEIYSMFDTYDINKLDINRMYRYLDKKLVKDIIINDDCELEFEHNYNIIE